MIATTAQVCPAARDFKTTIRCSSCVFQLRASCVVRNLLSSKASSASIAVWMVQHRRPNYLFIDRPTPRLWPVQVSLHHTAPRNTHALMIRRRRDTVNGLRLQVSKFGGLRRLDHLFCVRPQRKRPNERTMAPNERTNERTNCANERTNEGTKERTTMNSEKSVVECPRSTSDGLQLKRRRLRRCTRWMACTTYVVFCDVAELRRPSAL